MSPRGAQLARSLALTLELVREHRKLHPEEVVSMYRMLLSHVRSDCPAIFISTEMDQ